MKHQIYLFVGTTAEFIKLVPIIKELKKRKLDFKIITSGQNQIVLEEFKQITGNIKINHSFLVKQLKLKIHPIIDFAVWVMRSFVLYISFFSKEFEGLDKKNIYFIVHGDTISALMGALVAKINGVKVLHIESGLRSFNFFEPFPEEICRFFVSRLADIHFCPNKWSVNNLKGKSGIKINTQNNTLIESLDLAFNTRPKSPIRKIIGNKKYFLLILHRQEHIFFKKDLTKRLLDIFTKFSNKDLKCVLVLHSLTEKFLKSQSPNKNYKNVITIPRVPYIKFMKILSDSEFVATDGGSNQEECYYLGKPCLILRQVTERIEGLGKNAVLSNDRERLINNFLKNYKKYSKKPIKKYTSPSNIIVNYLTK